MKPLLFIHIVTGSSILIIQYVSSEVTWVTYYIGAMVGFIVSGIFLEIWNRRRRKQEERNT
jgi:hypothetical protein